MFLVTSAVVLLLACIVVIWKRGASAESNARRSDQLTVHSADHFRGGDRASENRVRRPREASTGTGFQELARRAMTTPPRLTLAEVEHFLSLRNRDADSLLCAYRQTEDYAYLHEALERFPENAEVLSAVLLNYGFKPENRQALIDRLKTVAPDNALGYYLSALEGIDAGIPEEALEELIAGSGKKFEDFSMTACQTDEEAFVTASYSAAEAKLLAARGTTKPATFEVFRLLKPLSQADEEAAALGDWELQGKLKDVRESISRQLQSAGTVVDAIVAHRFERSLLEGDDGPDSRRRLAELQDERARLVADAKRVDELLTGSTISETDWTFFFDRFKQFGEAAANEWLLERYE